jgi:hypothetical protein
LSRRKLLVRGNLGLATELVANGAVALQLFDPANEGRIVGRAVLTADERRALAAWLGDESNFKTKPVIEVVPA